MNRPSSDQLGKAKRVPLAISFQFAVAKSKSATREESRLKAATYRPSGDQRGEKNPFEPGTSVSVWEARSRMWMLGPGRGGAVPEAPPKQILLPSADHSASDLTCSRFASNSSGWPPLAETRYNLDNRPRATAK